MASVTIQNSMIMGSINASSNRTITVDNIIIATETVPAGKSGTAGAAGVMTLGSGHGLTDASVVAATWATGKRYNCTISAYDGTTVTLATGAGDALPTSGAVVISAQVELDVAFSGTQLGAMSIGGNIALITTLENAEGTVHYAAYPGANSAYQWDSGNGETNPVTGDTVEAVHVYNQAATAGTVTVLAGYNND